MVLSVSDVEAAANFWESLDMRVVERDASIAIFELRGGTHLILLPAEGAPVSTDTVPFDLMVDDLDATHRTWSERGLATSAITKGRIHTSFTLADPDGRALTVNSSHVVGAV
jgi:catechol 2,3-dioxygenase-like lactoylglutathione lyase family enzyme